MDINWFFYKSSGLVAGNASVINGKTIILQMQNNEYEKTQNISKEIKVFQNQIGFK